jgi:hypothetical protein
VAPELATAATVPAATGQAIQNRYIVVFKDDVRDVPGLSRQLAAAHRGTVRFTYQTALKGFAIEVPEAAATALAVLAAGFLIQRHYLERRYEDLSPQLRLAEAVRWANTVTDERIAIAGVRGVFNQYAFSGYDLSNHVQWLGIEGEHRSYERIPDCETWRTELNEGGYTYVVTLYDPYHPQGLTDTKEALWTREDPGASQVIRNGPVNVFRIDEPLNPEACDGLPDLGPTELDGDSVNEDPYANQPPPGSGTRVGTEGEAGS